MSLAPALRPHSPASASRRRRRARAYRLPIALALNPACDHPKPHRGVFLTNTAPRRAKRRLTRGTQKRKSLSLRKSVIGKRFPGQYRDSETGLHYNYFRDYDPSTGRYVESDPIGLSGGLNTYLYAKANPVRLIDPRGLEVYPVPPESGSSEPPNYSICEHYSRICKSEGCIYHCTAELICKNDTTSFCICWSKYTSQLLWSNWR